MQEPGAGRGRPTRPRWRPALAAVLLAASVFGFGLFILLASPIGHSIYAKAVAPSAVRPATPVIPATRTGQGPTGAGTSPHRSQTVAYGRPIRLMIPRLGLSAAVERVGLTPSGAMAAPKSPTTVAWYKYGPRPGDSGNAVIAGHSGYRNGATAAFDDLPRLRAGDLVLVRDANGVLARFIVRGSRTFDRRAKPGGVFEDGSTTAPHLNLVTCTGAWNAAAGTHADRLVVYTDALL